MARALADLPLLSDALRRGRISYSKVRAVTRVATPETEQTLLDVALAGTAAHVEQVVRAWRRVDRTAEAADDRRRRAGRVLHTWVDDDGMVIIRGRLTPEVGAVVRRALEAALDEQRRAASERSPDESDPVDEAVGVAPSFGQRQADALAVVAECALSGGLDQGSAGDRYQVVVHVDATTLAEEVDVSAGTPSAHAETGRPGGGGDKPFRAGNSRQMRRSPRECRGPNRPAAAAVVRRGQAALEEAGGIHVSAATAQRLACDAAAVGMRHGQNGQVLDVGRKKRTISPALRRALAVRDRLPVPGGRCDAALGARRGARPAVPVPGVSGPARRWVPQDAAMREHHILKWALGARRGDAPQKLDNRRTGDGRSLMSCYAPDQTLCRPPSPGTCTRRGSASRSMLVKVLIYAYATGVFSSRGDRAEAGRGRGVPGAGGGQFPATPDGVRVPAATLGGLQEAVCGGSVSGAGVGAGALREVVDRRDEGAREREQAQAMSYGRMQAEERRLADEIEALLRTAGDADAAEDARLGAEVRGDELPAELRRREDRLAAIRAAKARLEAAQRAADDAGGRQPDQDRNPKGGQPYKRAYGEPEEKAQSNFTDPESGIMKTSSEGFQQCYNAQVAVDGDHQLVVATEVTANASDQGGLPVLLDAVSETFDAQPETVLADAGYCNELDLVDLETRRVDGYVAAGREGKTATTRDPKKHPATSRMAKKLATAAGRAAYAERKWLSEAPHGWIKHVLGFRRFSLRGLAKACGEWDLVCLALNMKRAPDGDVRRAMRSAAAAKRREITAAGESHSPVSTVFCDRVAGGQKIHPARRPAKTPRRGAIGYSVTTNLIPRTFYGADS